MAKVGPSWSFMKGGARVDLSSLPSPLRGCEKRSSLETCKKSSPWGAAEWLLVKDKKRTRPPEVP